MNAIEIRNLTKSYGDFTLKNLNLTLPQGTIMGLIGENGAGKSTIIKLILNMIQREEGTITLLGEDNRNNLHIMKEEIGVVFDDVGIQGCLTPLQVGKIMRLTYANWNQEIYEHYLNIFKLPPQKKFKEFSRGMRMKLGIAIALSHNARLLILDEATSGIDPVMRDEILDLLFEFTRDAAHSILLSSHIVSDLEKICDYVAFLHDGELILCEEKDVLKEKYAVIRCSEKRLLELDSSAIIGRKKNAYGIEAIMQRKSIPGDIEKSSVDIEQLFICMARGIDIK